MAPDVSDLGDTIGSALGRIAREATHAASQNGRGKLPGRGNDGLLSGRRGVVAGAALAAAAPLAAKGAERVVKNAVGKRLGSVGEDVKDNVKGTVTDAVGRTVSNRIDKVGGVPGAVKEAGKSMIPGLGSDSGGGGAGGGGGGKKGTPGVGKGRRMPVQQAVEIAVPLEVAYNQWTQFEEWPQFMHRLVQVTQEDDCTVSFKTKMWGFSREFVAQIVEQRPDERIQWNVTEGVTHTGVVTFHELAPRLTRVQVSLDVEPGGLLEKAARGMRHVKRAVRADLARFKAFLEMQEVETGAWRGQIHDGEVVEEHDDSYDRGRDYADVDDLDDRESSHEPRETAARRAPAGSASGRRAPARRPAARRAPAGRASGRRAPARARSRSNGQHARGRSSGRRRAAAGRARG